MKSRCLLTLLSAGILFSLVFFNSSCDGDDDDGDSAACNALSEELGEETASWVEVIENSSDCEEIEDAYNELIDVYERGKNCSAFVKAVKDAGYDDVDDFIDDLEIQKNFALVDC